MKLPPRIQIGVEYPDDFDPLPGDDFAAPVYLNVDGCWLAHELGNAEPYCWCEPTIESYDEESGIFTYRHRHTDN